MDHAKIRAIIDGLRNFGIELHQSFSMDDPDEFLDALLSALRTQLPEGVEPVENAVVMSLSGHPLRLVPKRKSVSEQVDDFFSMLPGAAHSRKGE